MIIFSALGAIGLLVLVAAALTRRRYRHRFDLQAPRDIVFMEEDVLSEFLTAEYERNLERAAAAAPPPASPAPHPVSPVIHRGAEETLENGERLIPSMAGGVTAVAGPPTDLADEGWARDPNGRHEWRYFDSEGWSDFVLDGDSVDTDPISVISA